MGRNMVEYVKSPDKIPVDFHPTPWETNGCDGAKHRHEWDNLEIFTIDNRIKIFEYPGKQWQYCKKCGLLRIKLD